MVCAYTWILTQLTTSSAFSNARKYFLLFRCVALLVAVISSHFFATVIFFHFFCRFFRCFVFVAFLFRVFISFASFRFISGIVSNENGVRMYDFNASITMIEFFFSRRVSFHFSAITKQVNFCWASTLEVWSFFVNFNSLDYLPFDCIWSGHLMEREEKQKHIFEIVDRTKIWFTDVLEKYSNEKVIRSVFSLTNRIQSSSAHQWYTTQRKSDTEKMKEKDREQQKKRTHTNTEKERYWYHTSTTFWSNHENGMHSHWKVSQAQKNSKSYYILLVCPYQYPFTHQCANVCVCVCSPVSV